MGLVSTFFISACLAWVRGEPDPSLLLQKYIRIGTTEQVQSALSRGADPGSVGPDGRTPLMVAAANGDDLFVQLLLARHARPEVRDAQGRTALDLARLSGHEDAALALAAAKTPADLDRFPPALPERQTRIYPTAPFADRAAACHASVAMADIALGRACPAGMIELVPSESCECEKFMRGLSCRRPVVFSCRVPRMRGGLDVINVDPRGGPNGRVSPSYNVRGPAFVLDARPGARFLKNTTGRSPLSIVLSQREGGTKVLWSAPYRMGQSLYTVRPPTRLSERTEYVLAIVEDDGVARPHLLWLASVSVRPRAKQ